MRAPRIFTRANRLRAGIVVAVLAITWTSPHQALSCPVFVDSYTYYNGCGSLSIVGDEWEECSGITGGWGTTGHWRTRIRQTCQAIGASCYENSNTYTYWEYCSGTWVQRTQTQFQSADCQCS